MTDTSFHNPTSFFSFLTFRFALQTQSIQGKLCKQKCGRREIESIFRPRSEQSLHYGLQRKMYWLKGWGYEEEQER